MESSYRICEDDYVRAMLLASRPKLRGTVRPAAIVLAGVAILAWFDRDIIGYAVGGAFGLMLLTLYVVLLRRLVVPRSLRKHYARYRLVQEPVSIALTDAGIELEGPSYKTRYRWDHFTGWREDEDWFLVALAPRLYQIIPKRIASEGFDFDLLRARLAAAGMAPV